MRTRSKRLKDVLPKLGQVMVKDFKDFSDSWEDVLRIYAEVFRWLNEVLLWNSEDIEKTAVEIIEEYIRRRERGFMGNQLFPAYTWLACELGDIPHKMFDKLLEELDRDLQNNL
jgi:hypothetical protein